eukprot:353394-Chlamydomonas_euryale.AAC.5
MPHGLSCTRQLGRTVIPSSTLKTTSHTCDSHLVWRASPLAYQQTAIRRSEGWRAKPAPAPRLPHGAARVMPPKFRTSIEAATVGGSDVVRVCSARARARSYVRQAPSLGIPLMCGNSLNAGPIKAAISTPCGGSPGAGRIMRPCQCHAAGALPAWKIASMRHAACWGMSELAPSDMLEGYRMSYL